MSTTILHCRSAGSAIIGLIGWIVLAYVVGFGARFLLGNKEALDFGFFAVMAAACCVNATRPGLGWNPVRRWSLFLVLMGIYAALGLIVVGTSVVESKGIELPLVYLIGYQSLGAFLVIAVIAAPVVEECTYRGWLWQRFQEIGWSNSTTWVVTSLLFAAVHLDVLHDHAGWKFGVHLGMGLVLGLVRWHSNSTRATICLHMAMNSVPALILWRITQGGG